MVLLLQEDPLGPTSRPPARTLPHLSLSSWPLRACFLLVLALAPSFSWH